MRNSEEPKNIIFLDIDGVLNTTVSPDYKDFHFDATSVRFIRKLIKDCEAQVVVSSTWRRTSSWLEMSQLLHVAGLGRCVFPGDGWRTPIMDSERLRGTEIQAWLNEHKGKWKNYVIVDDDSDMLPEQFDNFVLTDHFTGFTFREFARAMQILKPEDTRYEGFMTNREAHLVAQDVELFLSGSSFEPRTKLGAQLIDMRKKS